MVKSKYLTRYMDWDERIRNMERNLNDAHYDYLFFCISLNLIDAQDNADYDREQILKKMLAAYKRKAYATIKTLLGQMKKLP